MTARLEKATEVVNAGSAIKSRIKEALEQVSRAYEAIRDRAHTAQIDFANADPVLSTDHQARGQFFYADGNDLPFQLNHVREAKHRATFERFGGEWQAVADLIALREAVKGVEVITREPKEPGLETVVKARVMKSFDQWMADRKAVFNWATEIVRELNAELPAVKRLPISINHVYCQNEHGTRWLRIDWYMNGRKVPFNTIVAAAETVQREKEGR
jgi:hypothetical protein